MQNILELLQQVVADFVSERNWEKYHTPKNLAMSVGIEAAELMEIFQWDDIDVESIMADENLLNLVNHEIADVMIYLLCLTNVLQVDLTEIVLQKIEHNKLKWDADRVQEIGIYRKDQL